VTPPVNEQPLVTDRRAHPGRQPAASDV